MIAAALVAVAVGIDEASSGSPVFLTLGKALVISAATLAMGSAAGRVWTGATVTETQLPGGVGIAFADRDATVTHLRLDLETAKDHLELRLALLEREVFGDEGRGNGAGVR